MGAYFASGIIHKWRITKESQQDAELWRGWRVVKGRKKRYQENEQMNRSFKEAKEDTDTNV